MYRHFTLLWCLFLCLPALWAEPVGKEQAMEQARQFYNGRGQSSKAGRLRQVARQTDVSMQLENDCFYVFTPGADDGFVIISGDDRTPSVLGYADEGSFSPDAMPDNMKAWLDDYARQISYLQQNRLAAPAKIATHPAIATMLTTKWNQDAPYNNQCPVFFDESKYGRAVTGCVALALAQIMKYWNYPKTSLKAIPGYPCTSDWSSYIGSSTRAYITVPEVGITTFDWDNMLNTYDGNASDAQKKAVATLLQACATSVKADFGISEVGGTSADAQSLKNALTSYFDYDKSMRYASRNSYTADQWDELVYSEMSAHRPVFFSGQSITSGHTFVVDGYDGKGYYHVNWGWGGLNNGYFLLSVLNPGYESSIGVGKGGYNLGVSALIGVKPNAGHDNPLTDIMTVTDGVLSKKSITRSSTSDDFKGITVSYSFYNKTGITTTFDLGYGIFDSDRNLKKVITVEENVDLLANQGLSSEYTKATFDFGAGITSGEYCIVPISKLSAATQWQPCVGAWRWYAVVTIDGNTLSLTPITKKIAFEIELVNTPEVKGPADLKLTFTNDGPYYNGEFYLFEDKNKDHPLYGDHLELQRGETKILNVSVVLNEQRSYVICGGHSVDDPGAAIPVTPTASKPQKLDCTYSVTNANASQEINSDQMEITIEFQNTGNNDYDNEVLINLMKREGTSNSWDLVSTTTDRLKLSKGAKKKCNYVLRDLEDGETYAVIPVYKSSGELVIISSSDNYTVNFSSTPPEIAEAYAVVDGTTLTFYYDGKKDSRQGKKYGMNTGDDFPGWSAESDNIKKAVIDSTFVAYSPASTAHWFEHHINLTSIEGMDNLNTSETTFMRSMFYESSALTSVDVSKFDTRNVTDMSWMFYGCTSLKSLDVSKFNTSKVTNMKGMFYNCQQLTTIEVSQFDTRNVTDMSWMFFGCQSVTGLGLSKFNTSKVTDMKAMLDNCLALRTIDVTSFDTSNVTDMSFFLFGCKNLQYIDLSKFNTSKVKDMEAMFDDCGLSVINLTSFDTQNVTNMSRMFFRCGRLNGVVFGSKFNTKKVTTMKSMFEECISLKTLDLSPFNTSSVTTMELMFSNCVSLTQLNVSSFNTSNVTNMVKMFYHCTKLESLDLSSITTDNVELIEEMFSGCSVLQTIYASNSWNTSKTTDGVMMFVDCNKLVGGAGTKYKFDINTIGKAYARIDGGTSAPGYFTYKEASSTGDVNGDNTVDVADIGNIIDVMAAGDNDASADVNGDNSVDVADIGMVIDIMAANSRRASATAGQHDK